MKKKPNIGAHVRTEGGLVSAIENAERIGAKCFQIFGASPRQWRALFPKEEDVKLFKKLLKEKELGPVFLHASYLVNLASANGDILEKSIKNLSDHLQIASMLGAEGLIFHVGSSRGMEKKKALDQEVSAMKEVLKNVTGSSLIMENTAGGGEKIGSIEDIGYLYGNIKSDRVNICFDTAHALEAGMIESYAPPRIKKLFDEWEEAVGLEHIVAIHANDSKTTYNSNHDRHENIGMGEIGMEGFKDLAKEKRLLDKCWILEVPGYEGNGPDRKNIETLSSCFL
ncbi:hypothetical protein A3A21_02640 [Candidatus Jorgensenbacteria bacterium RIFCSPLOWO2_01_FULL_45_25b]|uniref:Xylose isomerase-like TIM barrel domain-containing protein n=1 Tax=Candidatus Jorgensenbacteria bacterium RIFCSPLOWO2_01_FULL_45_25b TaxID=1798471 RepID=A0A1F6BZT8_9BACT|nr:MAG: hypothetical protein A3A21_02640 [Candidatus Jorgensenbacteria bacterium RIFCSPLOWO2_01_FULL_45_25b]